MPRLASRALILAAALIALVGARVWLRAGDGLSAQYFANADFSPPAAFTAADAVPAADAARAQWYGQTPDVFSVRWTGYLAVSDAATYEFGLTSDDAGWLFIDGQRIVSNPGQHAATREVGAVTLAPGAHRIAVEYVQLGGEMALALDWAARGASARAAVPWWRLSKRPATPLAGATVRILTWFAWLIGAALAALVAVPLWRRVEGALAAAPGAEALTISPRQRIGWLAVFIVLAALETWPLALSPGHMTRNDNADAMLNEWAIAWVAHQAPRNITHLFDANTFYPNPNVLAYSEALLVQSAFAAPVLWLGGSPVLASNVVLLLGLALSAWAMCLLVARWTRDWIAGASAGVIFAFSAPLLTRLPHVQALHLEFIPPMLWALDRLMNEPRLRRGVALGVWFSLQALTSYYLLVITAVGLAAASVARLGAWRARGKQVTLALGAAAGISALMLAPFLFQYWKAHHEVGLTRLFTDQLPTFWRDYLTTPSRLDQLVLAPFTSSAGLFPGFGGLLLAIYAVAKGALRLPRARMCLAFGIAGFIMSFGPDLPGYAWLHRVVVPLQGIRAASRFGMLLTVAVAVLAGMGFAELRRNIRTRRALVAVSLAIPLALVAESLAAPLTFRRFDRVPAIYGRLAGEPHAVVAEMPMPPGTATPSNAAYILNSTASWYRLINGYSGFVPESYWKQSASVADFPSAASMAALRSMGVTHLFVHRRQLGARASELAAYGELTLIAEEGDIALYRLQ